MKLMEAKKNVICYCDFCGKSDREARMIDGKHAFICEGCVTEARRIFQPKLTLIRL